MTTHSMYLGGGLPADGRGPVGRLELPLHHLTTHAVVVGMTGSGKTGLTMVMSEEALRAGKQVMMIDVKGDLANLLYLVSLGAGTTSER